MNHEMKEHIKQTLRNGKRIDGRKNDEMRPIRIETGFLSTAEGSARVRFGDAEVIAGVKLNIEKPFPDTPEDGVLMVNAELLPLSNPDFESGPPSAASIETARVIDRGIRESRTIDTKGLCIQKGEKVWTVALDIFPINFDGNLIDMGGLAALAALLTTRFPYVKEDGTIDYHKHTDKKIELSRLPIPITVGKIGDLLVIDPTDEEENVIDARLTITSIEDGRICSLQKGGNSTLTTEDINKMVEIAIDKAKEVRKKLEEVA